MRYFLCYGWHNFSTESVYIETRLQSQAIFCRILLHGISLGKHFPMSFFNFLQWMTWVCNDIIAMVRKTLINIKIQQFELSFSASNDLFKVNNRNHRKSYEICSRLTIKTTERCQWVCFGVFIVNLEPISHLFSGIYCWLWTTSCLLKLNY